MSLYIHVCKEYILKSEILNLKKVFCSGNVNSQVWVSNPQPFLKFVGRHLSGMIL